MDLPHVTDLDEHVHQDMYRKWVGVRVTSHKKQGMHKDENLCTKYERAARKRRRQRNRKDGDIEVMEIDDDCDAQPTSTHNIQSPQYIHIEEVHELPSTTPPTSPHREVCSGEFFVGDM